MITLAYILSFLSLVMSVSFFIKLKMPLAIYMLFIKLTAGAFSAAYAITGIAGAIIGLLHQAYPASLAGITGAAVMIGYICQCTKDHKGFEKAFGADWSKHIHPNQLKDMVQNRYSGYLNSKVPFKFFFEKDVAFWKIPGSDRTLLCDIWRPEKINASGLAFIYFHGSGWAALDKDFATRPFFRHLVSQGHTVMDVSYRLIPEVDIHGMLGDVKRSIAWMKSHSSDYGVDPEKIVLGGGSAGAHLALLAGYTPGHPELTAEDVKDIDLSVCGLVSLYGPTDLIAGYKEFNLKPQNHLPLGTKVDPKEAFRNAGRLEILLEGLPEEVPEMYKLACPTSHVHSGSPPTLLIQGEKDILVPVRATRELYRKLVDSGVPAINVVFPLTDHGFDLLFPQISPPAQSAWYDVDRFLALLSSKN